MLDSALNFEQGPIRPPSEAKSLLLRFSRNCPWNKCKFCPVYKGAKFSRRSIEEIKADIDTAAEMRRQIIALSHEMGHGGQISDDVVNTVFSARPLTDAFRNVAAWLYYGTGNVFLQDANNLIMPPETLAEALRYLREQLPEARRVTTYARSSSAARRSVGELTMIREAGLDRIHVGMESGCDEVLEFMKKGTTQAQQIKAGQNIKAAGLELSEYVMPGLGGRQWSEKHAKDTAYALNQINADFIRLRTLRVPPGLLLYEDLEAGLFDKLSEDEMAQEIRLFIANLDGITSTVTSDHIMNLIETVSGHLPDDKQYMLNKLDAYLAMPDDDRLLYRICRRLGRCREPQDVERYGMKPQLEELLRKIETRGDPDQVLDDIANGMI